MNKSDVDELLKLKPDDITRSLMISYFANSFKNPARFKANDKLEIPKGYYDNKEPIMTTVGRFIFNKFIIEETFMKHIGYINKTVDASVVEDIEQSLSELLLNKVITVKDYIKYLDKMQWFGFTNNDYIAPSINYATTVPLDSVMKRKEELMEKYKDDLENGNVAVVGAKIENELLDLAKEELKDDPAMDLFRSGARSKFGNHYKNISIMRGPIKDNSTGKFKLAESNYCDGIKKDEYSMFGDRIAASYSNVC